MRKLLFLAVLPLTLSACTAYKCPNPDQCAVCPICNGQSSTLTPPAQPATPATSASPAAPAAPAPTASAPAAAATPSAANPAASGRVYRMAPAKLVQAIQQAITAEPLNLRVASLQDGVIQTEWKDYEGEFHIARRWDDRTRYRISVIPDVNDPVNAARFEVTEETQRRSNSRANWQPADRHPERAEAVVQAINAKLQ